MASGKRGRRSPPKEQGATPVGAHAIWSGTISFGLVALPVDLYPALRRNGVALRLLAPDGAPLQRRYTCPVEKVDVPWEELVRGYQVADGEYVPLTDEELEAAAPRKSRDIDLRRFVDVDALDPFLFERGYVLTPHGDATKPYRLLADAMEQDGKAGIATFVMRSKEYLVAILARSGILWAETLRFADEVREPAAIGLPRRKPPPAKLVGEFARAIDSLRAARIDREELRDRRAAALQSLLERKRRRGAEVVAAPAAAVDGESDAGGPTPDLLDAIRRSLRAVGRRDAPAAKKLATLSKQELYERAQAIDLPGRSAMSKGELVAALRARP